MKKITTLLLLLTIAASTSFGQYFYRLRSSPGQNPGGLNTDAEFPSGGGLAAGWTPLIGPSITTPTWSPIQTIPFSFSLDASPVTQYKVSSNGILTFTTSATAVPSNTQAALPNAGIPDKSVCIWGLQTVGANDMALSKTFGTAPNRQHWVFYTSCALGGTGWSYWSIVMEETTNNIYIVDQRHSGTTGGVSMGIQMDATTAYSVTGSPSVLPIAGANESASDNAYYEFIQGVLPAIDGEMLSVESAKYVFVGSTIIEGEIENKGTSTITSFDLNYSVNNGATVTQNLTGLNIASFAKYSYSHSTPWVSTSASTDSVKVWMSNINGMGPDADPSNDEVQKEINVRLPNLDIIRSYTSTTNTFTYDIVGNSSDRLVSPTDLDFHPNGELWVVNRETEATGGSTVKFTNPSLTSQTTLRQQDGNAWHFMSLPTGIAFSDNGNFGTSTGVLNANHNNGVPFTGPALWSSDPLVYAQPSGGNGSHLDMLHASPHCMGIASETANIFYVYDANSNDIVRYDFGNDHGPGGADHDDGRIRRFMAPTVNWVNANIPSHLVMDKSSNWLYIADVGNGRVLRLDVSSGTVGGTPTYPRYETLAEYANVTGATWQVVADTGLLQPSGIDVIGDNMIVSDFSNGNIYIYDISTMPARRVGTLQTNTPGVSGLVIGPRGRIWYTNTTQNTVVKIIPSQVIGLSDNLASKQLVIYPNPTSGILNIENLDEIGVNSKISVLDISGRIVVDNVKVSNNEVNLSHLDNGVYFIQLKNESGSALKKIIINH